MKTFNLAEELEKERKKNKELEKQVEELKKVNKNFAENLASKENLSYYDYKERIDKAIEYNKKVLTWTTNEEITDEIANENLNILKGDNK